MNNSKQAAIRALVHLAVLQIAPHAKMLLDVALG